MSTSDAQNEPLQVLFATVSELQQIAEDASQLRQIGRSKTSQGTSLVGGTDSLNVFLREIDKLIASPQTAAPDTAPSTPPMHESTTSSLSPVTSGTNVPDSLVEQSLHAPQPLPATDPKVGLSEQEPTLANPLAKTGSGIVRQDPRQRRRMWFVIALAAAACGLGTFMWRADPHPFRSTTSKAMAISAPSQPSATTSSDRKANDSQPIGPMMISEVRSWSSSDGTHVEIYMNGPLDYVVHRIPNPDRIYFDFSNALIAPKLEGKTQNGLVSQLLDKIRLAKRKGEVARVTLVTKGACDYSAELLPQPYRLVITLREQRPRSQ